MQTEAEHKLNWKLMLVFASITASVESILSMCVSYALFKFYAKDINHIFDQEKKNLRNPGLYKKILEE